MGRTPIRWCAPLGIVKQKGDVVVGEPEPRPAAEADGLFCGLDYLRCLCESASQVVECIGECLHLFLCELSRLSVYVVSV